MQAEFVLFLLFSLAILFGGVMVIVARNPVHSVLFMLLAFVNIAGIFVLLGAEFLAVIQVLVYTGAILVLFLFVVMLLGTSSRRQPEMGGSVQLPVAILVGLALIVEIAGVLISSAVGAGALGSDTPQAIQKAGGNVEAIGQSLYTQWLLPFEVASVLLLVAAVGAIYLAKEEL